MTAWTGEDLDYLLSKADSRSAEGKFVAGFFTYECGEHFAGLPDPKRAATRSPLAWLGVFSDAIEFDHPTGTIHGNLPPVPNDSSGGQATIATEGLQISQEEYREKLAKIHDYLRAGHTYQVNFTDQITGHAESEPLAIYETLLQQQPVSFAAYFHDASSTILSFSPEMFYRVSAGRITTRPMKGTWPRGVNTAGDYEAAHSLQSDKKNRSEHVMIVDLLRNDLGRLCEYGTVQVDELFQVERYSTLLQMTSTISGTLRAALRPSEIFRTLFPSGSITGAPKRRTMEIIRELERIPRGIYTGAIGYFSPRGEASFSVAIRTLKLENKRLTLGVGGGITADSEAQQEYEECQLKAAFLTHTRPPVSLIETMRCENGIALLPLHLERLADSADYFSIRYEAAQLIGELNEAVKRCGSTISRIRLRLNEDGKWNISAIPFEESQWNGRILLAKDRIQAKNIFVHHKTTNRKFYDRHLEAAQQQGFDEVLFLNESSQFTEGAISNFFFRVEGKWLTPRLASGVLPGVQRAFLLKNLADAEECELKLEDLRSSDQIFACNALRGLRYVQFIEANGESNWKQARPHSITGLPVT